MAHNYNPTTAMDASLSASLVGGGVANVVRATEGADYGVEKANYQLNKILSDANAKRNPYQADVSNHIHFTKYSSEMPDFSDRDYYMMMNDFEAGTDSEAYYIRYMKTIGSHKQKWDRAYQEKRSELLAEHYTESEANRIASDYVEGLRQVDMSIIHTRFPKATVEKSRDKMWSKPTINVAKDAPRA